MKKFLLAFFVFSLGASALFANSTRSAQFYLNTPEKYEGKKIVLYTAFVTRRGAIEKADKVLFSAYTMSRDGDDTSYIDVLVPTDKADVFSRRYGTDFKYQGGKPRKLLMSGVLKEIAGMWFLEFGAD